MLGSQAINMLDTISRGNRRSRQLVYLLAILAFTHLNLSCEAFAPASSIAKLLSSSWPRNDPYDGSRHCSVIMLSAGDTSDDDSLPGTTTDGPKMPKTTVSLEEKMKSWEATDEEIRAASLGGIVPQRMDGKGRSDAFDVGLYIAFPIMVISGLLFALFPLIVGNLDVDSVGPPPTI
jgi:hypothetical protein